MLHELRTGFLGAHRIVGLQPAPMVIPIVRPSPSVPIAICRSVCRIHVLKTIPSMYAATLLFVRASDFGIMGGCAADTGLLFTNLQEALVDRDTDWGSQRHFRLEVGDVPLAVFQTYAIPTNPEPAPYEFLAEIDILFAYTLFDDDTTPVVQFVSPSTIPHNTTFSMVIVGDGFMPGATVQFIPSDGGVNGTTATAVTVTNRNRIDATVVVTNDAVHNARSIVVTNPNGRSGGLQNALVIT